MIPQIFTPQFPRLQALFTLTGAICLKINPLNKWVSHNPLRIVKVEMRFREAPLKTTRNYCANRQLRSIRKLLITFDKLNLTTHVTTWTKIALKKCLHQPCCFCQIQTSFTPIVSNQRDVPLYRLNLKYNAVSKNFNPSFVFCSPYLHCSVNAQFAKSRRCRKLPKANQRPHEIFLGCSADRKRVESIKGRRVVVFATRV